MKKIIYTVLIIGLMTTVCSCGLLKNPIDDRTGFSNHLKDTESNIRAEEWEKAKSSLDESVKTWKKVKPLLQIDIDHDYVNSIEDNFIKLDAYIETREKGNSLASIKLVEDVWENIGSL